MLLSLYNAIHRPQTINIFSQNTHTQVSKQEAYTVLQYFWLMMLLKAKLEKICLKHSRPLYNADVLKHIRPLYNADVHVIRNNINIYYVCWIHCTNIRQQRFNTKAKIHIIYYWAYLVKDDIPSPDRASLEYVLQRLRDPVVHLLPQDLNQEEIFIKKTWLSKRIWTGFLLS